MKNSEFTEDERQIENDEDIGLLQQSSISSAVLSGNDWTVETIVSQINKGNIQLNPKFQRRDAWDKSRKSKYIESLILGLPVPQIVLAESKDRRGSYIVLDGKQRLLSIRQFTAQYDDPIYNSLKLFSLEIRSDLNGLNLEGLRANLDHYDDLSSFDNQPIRTVVIKNWPNEQFLYHIFLRLNTGSVSLSPQELRQALHPGDFVSFIDEFSSKSSCLQEILKISKPDFRMRDAELMLRFLALKNFLNQYTGGLKEFLDQTCKTLNRDWGTQSEKIVEQVKSSEISHIATMTIFKKNSYRKWTGNEYESRFNRAIFDVMALSMSNDEVRHALKGNETDVEKAFQDLCSNNTNFRASIESTTKSLWATHTRISLWNQKLNEVLGINLHVPSLVGNRIV